MPDRTGAGLDMDYWVAAIGASNRERPFPGDVVARFESCGMGMTVRRDIRYVVTSETPRYETSFAVRDARDGSRAELHVHNLRRHRTLARTWIEIT